MNTIRIIPRLDIKGPNLVKGVHLEGLRVLGKPEDFARYYYEQGADELLYVDVVASLYNRNSLHDIVTRTAREVFIPLTVAGGLRTLDDIRNVLRAGADKVALNTAAIKNPAMIEESVHAFGSSTITIAMEVMKQPDGRYLAFTDNGREFTGIEALSWAKKVESLGAGEILLTSIDREGTGKGFDIELTSMIADAVGIPVIACGGAGKVPDIRDVIESGHADAVAAASVLHYNFITKHAMSGSYEHEGNTEYLQSPRANSKLQPTDIPAIKQFLVEHNIPCRIKK